MTPEELRLAEAYRVALRIRLHRLAKHLPLDRALNQRSVALSLTLN